MSDGYGFQGLVMPSTSSYNGLNKTYPAVLFITVRTLGLFVPLAWAGSALLGLQGVMWAGLIANIFTGIAAYTNLRKVVGKLRDAATS